MDVNSAPPRQLNQPANVLLVDDDPLMRWSLAETLKQHGYLVVEALDAQTALEAVREARTPFGVVVVDVRVPDLDDLSLLIELHRYHADALVIVTTARGSVEFAGRALDFGAHCVLHKPFGMDEFAEIVDRATDSRRCVSGGQPIDSQTRPHVYRTPTT